MRDRVVWLDGGLVVSAGAGVSIDDPGVRYGEGLFETMRGHDGRIPWLDRHLDRLERSVAALGLAPSPRIEAVRNAAMEVAERLAPGPARVRITVTPRPTLLVEGEPIVVDPDLTLSAAAIRGTWHPKRREAEHKTLSFLGWRTAQRAAEAAGAEVALMLGANGRLGEASTANVFCVADERLTTAPVRGLLPGVTRAVVMELVEVREKALAENAWRRCDEMFVTSAVRGVVPVVTCDGLPIGSGTVGPITRRVARAIREQLEAG